MASDMHLDGQSQTQTIPSGGNAISDSARNISRTASPSSADTAVSSQEQNQQVMNTSNEEKAVEPQKPSANNASTIPNGGLQAWMQVVGSFVLFFNTWGVLNTFGEYQTYYESGRLFTQSSSNISWIGSIQAFCVMVVGFLSGPIYDRGYLRYLLVVGSFLIVFGHMMLSLCQTYWQCLLAQGFCIGIGAGCLFTPAVALLPSYFSTKIGLAIGLASSGSSLGGVIYPIVFYRLIPEVGFPWAVRVVGFIALATLIVPIFVNKMRVVPKQARALIDFSAFTDWPYMLFTLGAMIGFIGLYVGFFYIAYYAEQQRITDSSLAFYLIPILNAASVLGRTIPNAISDIIGPLNIMVPGSLIVGMILLLFMAVVNTGGIVVLTILFGFFSGIFIALPPVLFAALTKDKSKIGTRMGMGFGMVSAGVLCGGPGAGAILGNVTGGAAASANSLHWNSLWIYGGVTDLAAGLLFIGLRMWRSNGKAIAKV